MTTTDSTALSAIIAELQDLLTWPENWNSYDALPPDAKAVAHATQWIAEAYQLITVLEQQWIQPHITACADGSVNISWRYEQRMLEMLIDYEEISYLQKWDKGVYTDGDIRTLNDMQQLWQWLLDTAKDVQV